MMNKVKENVTGQKLNGREMIKPDVKLSDRLSKYQANSLSPINNLARKGSQNLILDET